ncbi:hypothetical protein X777_11916 [Ooceraea biroi]|uniref:Uncharacterized protein n=1 Tax=Ooceraea biroi TaxID=2015173 RepID=A0A026W037_OOCBI|nr:hypothetical protein X777_11916 [Ooceraea biroi]
MHRIAYCGALLLLVAVTSTNSTKCSRLIDGVTRPRASAEGKYHFFVTLFNRTEHVNDYMPNTRYSGKYSMFERENAPLTGVGKAQCNSDANLVFHVAQILRIESDVFLLVAILLSRTSANRERERKKDELTY